MVEFGSELRTKNRKSLMQRFEGKLRVLCWH
jgi:hypothetical protein